MSDKRKKESLFKRGVSAANAVFGCEDIYICPICITGFQHSALAEKTLTFEHAPPKAIGGQGILLTCQKCNNVSGYSIDRSVDRRAKSEDFVRFFHELPDGVAGRATLTINNKEMRVDITRNNGVNDIKIVGGSNDPSVVKEVIEYLRGLSRNNKTDGEQLHFSSFNNQYNDRHAQVSDLRWAFLVCTAYFGYSFARSPSLNDVREQILNPDKSIVPQWYVYQPQMENSKIYLCEAEDVVVAKYRDRAVILLWSDHQESNVPKLVKLAEAGTINLTFRRFSWPTTFHAYCDVGESQKAT